MKTPFKFHPIHVAVLTILFTPTWSYAQQNQHSASTESYDGQSFYERYYVKHAKKNEQGTTPSAQKYSSYYCQGTWVTPVANNTPVGDLTDSETHIEADYGYYHPTGDSELSGNVVIEQQGRQIRADKLRLDPTHTYATVEGRVELAQDGIVAQGDAVRYNLKEQTGDFENSYYISENTHAHGKASKISRPNRQTVKLNDATYSACAPSASPTWKLQAKEIELNQETGRGITKGTKLYIKDVPVLAVPYFNFPIDDRRTTGLLTPTVGYTNDGGVQLGVPIYLNLAPNYDATLTPRYLSERGAMLDGQFRYLTKNFGEGQIWGGYLPSDNKYNDEDRKDLHFAHQWQINPQWQTGAEYHYASDKDFFSDLSDNPNTYTTLNLRRAWNLSYANGIPGLTANLKVEKFQTLDKNVLDRDRPYARLPQFLLNYTAGNTQGWQWDYHNDTAYFKKSIRDGSALESSGTRLYNKAAVRYNFRRSYGFAIPELSVASINMWYDEDSIANLNANQSQSQSVVV
ncbi:MAG: LPS assembly protein LptD, partial [Acinetobacter sp.]|nr:LPS assembly protein LptD [Acinetobacter sp.]